MSAKHTPGPLKHTRKINMELLKALEGLVEWFELDVEPSTKTFARWDSAKLAISKAKGDSQP